MIVAGDVELPDHCPEDCPFKEDIARYGQNAMCGHCPVFCCTAFGDDEDEMGPMCLVEPHDYRRDWALAWKAWFENGMKDFPELKLKAEG